MTAPRRRRTEAGAATAELAMALPLLIAVTIGLVWLLAVGAARAAARGDSSDSALARGLQVAPAGSRVSLHADGAEVTAVVVARVSGPGGLFGALPAVTVSADAVAAVEVSDP